MRIHRASLITCILVLGESCCFAAPPPVTVEPREQWSNCFGEKEVVLHFRVKTARAIKGRATWALVVGERAVLRGESLLESNPEKPAEVTVRLDVPPVKDGVIFAAHLTLSVIPDGEKKPAATLTRPLWIFPDDPFASRAVWLKDLKITLFDPEKQTAEQFRKAKIPFEETRNVAALTELGEGMVIVGEGISFKDYPELTETLTRAAARGLPVLCLAPAKGSFEIPGSDQPRLLAPTRLVWKRQDIIAELDKRLDAVSWPNDTQPVRTSLVIRAEEGKVIGTVTAGAEGWTWLEAGYAREGRLIVCGFRLVESWDRGPTPRFLLARILEHAAGKHESSPKKKGDE
jgi:hypothetical protein